MTDKWLSELTGGDSWGGRGCGEDSPAQHSPAAELQRRYGEGAKRNAETGEATQLHIKTEAQWCPSGGLFICKMPKTLRLHQHRWRWRSHRDCRYRKKYKHMQNPNSLVTPLSQVSSYCSTPPPPPPPYG